MPKVEKFLAPPTNVSQLRLQRSVYIRSRDLRQAKLLIHWRFAKLRIHASPATQ
jgi:hypothetical protein